MLRPDFIFSTKDGRFVVKKTVQREFEFYEDLEKHPWPFQKFLPKYYGQIKLLGVPVFRGKKELSRAIILENIAYGFVKPNIIDLKLGKVMYSKYHETEHQGRKKERAQETTSGSLGICFAGIQFWIGGSGGYIKRDREWGRRLDEPGVKQAFREYFALDTRTIAVERPGRPGPELIVEVIGRFIEEVTSLKETLSRQETEIVSSSLLLVYEGDEKSLKTKLGLRGSPRATTIGVIDFPYADRVPGKGADKNLLAGVETTINILKSLQREARDLAGKRLGGKVQNKSIKRKPASTPKSTYNLRKQKI